MARLQVIVDGETVIDKDIESVEVSQVDDGSVRLLSPIPNGPVTFCPGRR
ncbi:hypothetical protein MTY414_59690 [Mycolicibacterium mageritense]|nr:hypothetical protein MTY414_59690 [Mycolicibacterium mageritense]